jgi:ribosome-associated protein
LASFKKFMGKRLDFRKIAKQSAKIIKEKKGKDILILDVRKISDFTDYLVIASGTSDTHIRTLFNEVSEKLSISPNKKETKNKARWVVLDYGGVVVHIFHNIVRKFYNLESNWASAKEIDLEKKRQKKC